MIHGPTYGDIVLFCEDAAHRGDILGFIRAQLLLVAQADLMAFFKNITEVMLEGATLETPSSGKWQAMCQKGFQPREALLNRRATCTSPNHRRPGSIWTGSLTPRDADCS